MLLSKIILPICFFFSLTPIQGQEANFDAEKKVQETIISLFDALSGRDSMIIKSHCTPDVRFYEYGSTWNLDTIIQKAVTTNQAVDFRRSNSFDFLNTTIHENIAWTTYNLRSEISRTGKQVNIHWLETVILVSENNKWKIKVLHSSLIKREG